MDDIENPKTYVLGRDTNIGYVCFDNDTSIVDSIARVFPVFFFLGLDFLKLHLEGFKLVNDGLQGLSALSVHIYSP